MSDVVSFLEDVVGDAWDALEDVVKDAWDAYVWVFVEIPFAIFGIVDEDVVVVQKVSSMVYGTNEIDVVHQASVKAVMSMLENSDSFFPWYIKYTSLTRAQINSFYSFAKQGRYIHGLPNMEIRGGDIDFTAIDLALDDSLGFAATRLSANTTYPSDEIYIKDNLQESPYFYIPWANTLTFGGDATWTITSIVYNSGPDNFTVNISHGTLPDDTITQPGYIKVRTLVVTYHADTDPSTEWFYWLYVLDSGTYPDIDPGASVLSNLEMLPVAILKREGGDINADKTTEEYKTTKRLIDTLDLNLDDIITNVNENTDYALVQDLFINFAVCPSSEPEIVSKLLWEIFHNLAVVNGITSNTGEYYATFEEQDVNNAMVWNDHSHTAGISGTLASGQFYEHEIVIYEEIKDGGGEIIQEASTELHIRYQTAAGLYSEIIMYNLSGMAAIKKVGYHSMALNKLGDLNFTIPISVFIINQLNQTEQMEVYQHILRIDSYAIDVIHLEYYETPTFFSLFEFAMIIITVYSLGTASGPIAILKQLITQYLVMEIVVYIAELTGNAEFAAIVGFVAMVALSPGTGAGAFDFASAEGLIRASTQFTHNLTAAYNVETQMLKEDMEALNELAEERLEEIKDATPEESIITAEFLVGLNSVDTTVFPAIKAQYDFDLLYNYDRIIKDYYDINLRTGVI